MNAPNAMPSQPRTRLTKSLRARLELLDRVINAVTVGWPPGLAYLMVVEYAARRSESELHALFSDRRRARRALGTRVYLLARTIYSTDQAVLEWLSMPLSELGGRRPRDLLATPSGTRRVERLLRAMSHGVPT